MSDAHCPIGLVEGVARISLGCFCFPCSRSLLKNGLGIDFKKVSQKTLCRNAL
jgi:hypothetical protein